MKIIKNLDKLEFSTSETSNRITHITIGNGEIIGYDKDCNGQLIEIFRSNVDAGEFKIVDISNGNSAQ